MACGKITFFSRSAAESHIKATGKKTRNGKRLSVYCCPHCGNYHLTSWTPKKRRFVARVIAAAKRKNQRDESEDT